MRTGLTLSVLFLLSVVVAADDPKPAGKTPAFEQFKKLAGDWEGTMSEGGKGDHTMKVAVSYKVTSGGSAVVETIGPGSDHEMVTLIHPDGDSIVLTHYCMLGNQPQMKAAGTADGKKVPFKFVKATNLKTENDLHMHEVTFTFVDADTLKTEWTTFKNGKPDHTGVFEMKRKK